MDRYKLKRMLYGFVMQMAFISLAVNIYALVFLGDTNIAIMDAPPIAIPFDILCIIYSYYMLTRVYPYERGK